jgi:hypothetical protein
VFSKVPRNSVQLKLAMPQYHLPSHLKYLKPEGSTALTVILTWKELKAILGNLRERVADTAISQTMGPINACQ